MAREAVALLLAPLILAATVLAPPWAFLLVVGAAVTVAGWELLTMAAAAGHPVLRWPGVVALAAVLGAAWGWGVAGLAVAVTAAAVVLPAAQLGHPATPRGSLAGAAVTLYVAVALGATGAALGWLRTVPRPEVGFRLVLFHLLVIWVGDSGAYYVGRRLGRRPMAPAVSPRKTMEGLAGGIAATFVAAAAARTVLLPQLGWGHAMALAAILAVAAPLGDLVESQLKRDTGVKDSSSLLPGHGGLLDRTDSLLFAAPPVLAYVMLTGCLS